MATAGVEPHADYVKYAFGHKPAVPMWFYYPHRPGDNLRFGEDDKQAVARYVYHTSDDGTMDAFSISLCGFTILASRAEITGLRNQLMGWTGVDWLDRVACLEWRTDLGWYRIHLDWRGDPAV